MEAPAPLHPTPICVFTGTRAEYGLLHPLMCALRDAPDFRLQVLVSGAHLSPEFGLTVQHIRADGFEPDAEVEMLLSADTPTSIAKSMAVGLMGYADALARLRPAVLVVLGDRYEALAVATAAAVLRIPVAHLHGGEATFGALDESFRHAITKLSALHFTATEAYRRRVIQLGEAPDRVFHVGAIGLDHLRSATLMTRAELEADLGFALHEPTLIVTYHPVTTEHATATAQQAELLAALDEPDLAHLHVIFTKPNADADGRGLIAQLDAYVAAQPHRCRAYTSLGFRRYLSCLQYVAGVAGNSSSGIIEAPSFGIGTLNIGDRQAGRIQAGTTLNCAPQRQAIAQGLRQLISADFRNSLKGTPNPYDAGGAVPRIMAALRAFRPESVQKKAFYDVDFTLPS